MLILVLGLCHSQRLSDVDCDDGIDCTIDFYAPAARTCEHVMNSSSCEANRASLVLTSRENLVDPNLGRFPDFEISLHNMSLIASSFATVMRDVHVSREFHLKFLKVDPANLLDMSATLIGRVQRNRHDVHKLWRHIREVAGRINIDTRPRSYLSLLRTPITTLEFHTHIRNIFLLVRDGHTAYFPPFIGIGFYPFRVLDFFTSNGRRRVVVVEVARGVKVPPTFEVGVEVLTIDGVPVLEAAKQVGRQRYSANPENMIATGLEALTYRTFVGAFPNRDFMSITYRSKRGKVVTSRLDFMYAIEKGILPNMTVPAGTGTMSLLMNRGMKRASMGEGRSISPGDMKEMLARMSETYSFNSTGAFVNSTVRTKEGSFGKIAVRDFGDSSPKLDDYFAEFRSMLLHFPQNEGVVIDIRNNPGGNDIVSSALAQLLTDAKRLVRTNNVEVRLSETTRDIAIRDMNKVNRTLADRGVNANTKVGRFLENQQSVTLEQAWLFGDKYFAVQKQHTEFANEYEGKRFTGPVIILVDAKTFSAAENFASVIQDSFIAPIVGVSANTEGGGSFPQFYSAFSEILPEKFPPLKVNAAFSTRRAKRSGDNQGQLYEYFGVTVDKRYWYTKDDILNGDVDLNLFLKRQLRNVSALIPSSQRFDVMNPFTQPV